MNFKKIKTDFAVSLARFWVMLPLPIVLSFGRFLGRLSNLIPNKRSKIAQRNIELCFPEKSKEQQKALLKSNLISTGQGFSEMLIAFWAKQQKFMPDVVFHGLEHVDKALVKNKGCILLSCHLHPMELAVRAINIRLQRPGYMLARQHNNKVYEAHIDSARRSHCEKTIDKKDLRTVIKSLKANRCLYYYPDQNFSYHCQYIDFFKQPAATVVAIAKLAKSSQAEVVPWFVFRKNNKWHITFLHALSYFHSDSIEHCLSKMNRLFEQQISKHPEQYLWVHRRFKNHPKGRNYLYKDI